MKERVEVCRAGARCKESHVLEPAVCSELRHTQPDIGSTGHIPGHGQCGVLKLVVRDDLVHEADSFSLCSPNELGRKQQFLGLAHADEHWPKRQCHGDTQVAPGRVAKLGSLSGHNKVGHAKQLASARQADALDLGDDWLGELPQTKPPLQDLTDIIPVDYCIYGAFEISAVLGQDPIVGSQVIPSAERSASTLEQHHRDLVVCLRSAEGKFKLVE